MFHSWISDLAENHADIERENMGIIENWMLYQDDKVFHKFLMAHMRYMGF